MLICFQQCCTLNSFRNNRFPIAGDGERAWAQLGETGVGFWNPQPGISWGSGSSRGPRPGRMSKLGMQESQEVVIVQRHRKQKPTIPNWINRLWQKQCFLIKNQWKSHASRKGDGNLNLSCEHVDNFPKILLNKTHCRKSRWLLGKWLLHSPS